MVYLILALQKRAKIVEHSSKNYFAKGADVNRLRAAGKQRVEVVSLTRQLPL